MLGGLLIVWLLESREWGFGSCQWEMGDTRSIYGRNSINDSPRRCISWAAVRFLS